MLSNLSVLENEKRTVKMMIKTYCSSMHTRSRELCPDCNDLLVYSMNRLDSCPYGIDKMSCRKCPTHCYKIDMRNKIRQVMRKVGPVLFFYHPVLAINYILKKGSKND